MRGYAPVLQADHGSEEAETSKMGLREFSAGLEGYLRKQSRNFKTLLLRDALASFSGSVTEAYQNLYLRVLGASITEVGMVRSLSSIVDAITSLPAGMLTDRYNLKKLILFGLFVGLGPSILFVMANDWRMVIAATIGGVIAARLSLPALQVSFIDCMKDSERATGIGFFATVRSIVSAVAPIIAAFVVTYFGGITANGIRSLYLFPLAVCMISIVIVWKGLTQVEVQRARERPSSLSFFTDIFKGDKSMRQFLVMEMMREFTVFMVNPFFFIYAVEAKHADPYILGLMTTAQMLITVFLALPLGRLSDRVGRKKVVYYFRIFRYATDIGLILAPSPQFLVLVGVFRGIRLVSQDVSYSAFIFELVPLEKRGRWIAISSLLAGFSGAIATPLGGFLYESFAPEALFIFLTLFDLLIIMPIFSRIPERRKVKQSP